MVADLPELGDDGENVDHVVPELALLDQVLVGQGQLVVELVVLAPLVLAHGDPHVFEVDVVFFEQVRVVSLRPPEHDWLQHVRNELLDFRRSFF